MTFLIFESCYSCIIHSAIKIYTELRTSSQYIKTPYKSKNSLISSSVMMVLLNTSQISNWARTTKTMPGFEQESVEYYLSKAKKMREEKK